MRAISCWFRILRRYTVRLSLWEIALPPQFSLVMRCAGNSKVRESAIAEQQVQSSLHRSGRRGPCRLRARGMDRQAA
jgi:hypothetical protein